MDDGPELLPEGAAAGWQPLTIRDHRVRIQYFADIRFPLERANGVQTMETCHALARRGHHVRLTVRPDTARPPRNPFTYYGLEPIPQLRIDQVAVPSHPAARRGVYLAQAWWRAMDW